MRLFLIIVFFVASFAIVYAQNDYTDNKAVVFEELFDDPYDINKLFVGFQPLYAELFATNVNAGFGLEGSFYSKSKFDLKFSYRSAYGNSLYDLNRDNAMRNSDHKIDPTPFRYLEFGGSYHLRDIAIDHKARLVLFKRSYKGAKWESRVPLYAEVPSLLRKIYGLRVGGALWRSTTDINRVLERQQLSFDDLTNVKGESLPQSTINSAGISSDFMSFSNLRSVTIYLGGSITRIRNVAVSFDNYENGADDGIILIYADILVSPIIEIDPIEYNGDAYSTKIISSSMMGFRIGIDGKFNRTLGWSYGGEIGSRPGIKGIGFYTILKIGFPLFGSGLNNTTKAVQKR